MIISLTQARKPSLSRSFLPSLFLLLCIVGCADDSSSPTGSVTPPSPVIPQVAGVYMGPVTGTASMVPGISTGEASMRLLVMQTGDQLTITISAGIADAVRARFLELLLRVEGFGMAPRGMANGRIDANGSVTFSTFPDYVTTACGTVTTTGVGLRFSGDVAQLAYTATSELCGPTEATAAMQRL